jgi:hypothetical protein
LIVALGFALGGPLEYAPCSKSRKDSTDLARLN